MTPFQLGKVDPAPAARALGLAGALDMALPLGLGFGVHSQAQMAEALDRIRQLQEAVTERVGFKFP